MKGWAVAYLLKRCLDVVSAASLLILLLPIMVLIGLLLRAQGGPALFAHRRVGRLGRSFPCYKFRTMLPDAEQRLNELLSQNSVVRHEWERDFKLKHDPRVTPLGDFLRKYSLDELPQLWNVLKGEMSLVGPRPVVREELDRYGEHIAEYMAVRPGITGLWQVSGRSDTTYEYRVALDTQYVRNWSLWLDCVILARTVKVVICRDGAY